MLLAITAGLALILSAAGVYGVISYVTSRRTQEIGVRMAIGATAGSIFALIFRQGFATVAIGMPRCVVVSLASRERVRCRRIPGAPVLDAGAVTSGRGAS